MQRFSVLWMLVPLLILVAFFPAPEPGIASGVQKATSLAVGVTPVTGGTPGDCLIPGGGNILSQQACGLAFLTVGNTDIQAGTNGYVEYDNDGVLGELPTTGSGDVVLASSPSVTVNGQTCTLGSSCNTNPTYASLTAATGNISNTETVVVSMSIPANTFVAGGMLRVYASGTCTTSTSPGASTWQLRIGPNNLTGTAINIGSPSPNASQTSQNYLVNGYETIRSISGSTATIDSSGFIWAPVLITGATPSFGGEAGATFNPTVTNLVQLTFVSGASTSSCYFFQALIEQIV